MRYVNQIKFRRALLQCTILGAVSCGLSGTAVRAQTADTAADASAASSSGDIVVTARKTSERIQDVPLTINAVSGDQLRERHATDVKDILQTVPGLSFGNVERGRTNYNIRGVSTAASSPTVGLYLDDVSLVTLGSFFSGGVDPVFFDMARVEVLKGPQGTLYGGSSMGGAIKYVSVQPVINELSGVATAGVNTVRHGGTGYNANGVINVPVIADKLAIRLGAYYNHEAGYIDNVANAPVELGLYAANNPPQPYVPLTRPSLSTINQSNWNYGNTYVGRASATWTPDSSWKIVPSIFYQNYRQNATGEFFPNLAPLTSSYAVPSPTRDKFYLSSLTVTKDLGSNVTLTSLTGYIDRTLNFDRDYTYLLWQIVPSLSPLLTYNTTTTRTKTFSQEVRLSSKTRSLNWVAGLYYQNQRDRLTQVERTPGGAAIIGSDVDYSGDTRTKIEQYAAFGEVTLGITDALDLTAGFRLFGVKQRVDAAYDGLLAGGPSTIDGKESSETGFNPKFGISYKIRPENLVYASATKGFRPGGPNRYAINSTVCASDLSKLGLKDAPSTFKSDDLWTYELGSKNQFADRKITLNVSAYHTNWKNIQQSIVLATCGFSFNGNAGRTEINGLEGELSARPIPGVELGVSGSYTDAKIKEAVVGTSPQVGDAPLYVPKYTASAFVSYSTPINSDWEVNFRGDYSYTGRTRNNFARTITATSPNGTAITAPSPVEFQNSYQVVNAALSFQSGKTSIRLYAQNITDAQPALAAIFGAINSRATTLRPRTFGIELSQGF